MSYSVIVKVDPGFNTSITGSPGHAWIEIYGPGGAGPNGLIGAYGFSSLNSEPFGPGQVRNEGVRQFESANGYTSPSIPLTQNQYVDLMTFVLLRQKTPGDYSIIDRNCTFFVRAALNYAGLPIGIPGAPAPESLLFNVQNLLANMGGGGGGGGAGDDGSVPIDSHGAPLEYEVATYELTWRYEDGWSLVYEMTEWGEVISKEWIAPPSDPKGGLGDGPESGGWRALSGSGLSQSADAHLGCLEAEVNNHLAAASYVAASAAQLIQAMSSEAVAALSDDRDRVSPAALHAGIENRRDIAIAMPAC